MNTRIRYYIEHLPQHEDPHHESQKSNVRFHSRQHHWLRIDDTTIIGMAHFRDVGALTSATSHKAIIVLAHLHSKTTVKELVDKKSLAYPEIHSNRYVKLKAQFNLADDDHTTDFIGKLLAQGHSQFEPQF